MTSPTLSIGGNVSVASRVFLEICQTQSRPLPEEVSVAVTRLCSMNVSATWSVHAALRVKLDALVAANASIAASLRYNATWTAAFMLQRVALHCEARLGQADVLPLELEICGMEGSLLWEAQAAALVRAHASAVAGYELQADAVFGGGFTFQYQSKYAAVDISAAFGLDVAARAQAYAHVHAYAHALAA